MASRAAKVYGKRNPSRKYPGWGKMSKRAKRKSNREWVKRLTVQRKAAKSMRRARQKAASAKGKGVLPF